MFSVALTKTLQYEGGYSNHPNDKGGETYKGISRVHFPEWSGWAYLDRAATKGDVDWIQVGIDLRFHVESFYKVIWDLMSLDEIDHQPLADELFDIAVNMGNGRAIKFLQEALNVLNRNQTLYPDLKVDGLFGPVTRAQLLERKEDYELIEKVVVVLRGAFYLDIMRANPTQEAFARGWLKRIQIG